MTIRKALTAAVLTGVVAAGCVDLEVQNPLDPDRERALRTASDIEALVGGSYRNWYNTNTATTSVAPILTTVAYMHSATAANFGMVQFSSYPKEAVHHLTANSFYGEFANNWTWLYRAVSAVTDGLRTLDEGAVTLPADQLSRVRAYGYFVLGLAHGSAALLYDQGYIYDPSISVDDVELAPYTEVMSAAYGYFDRAIQEASGQSFTVPALWMANDVSAAELVRLAHSYKARYRANIARTPAERAAANWDLILSDIDKGITETFAWDMRQGSGWSSGAAHNMFRFGPWGQLSYQVLGMADQSGQYQKWLSRDPWDRHPNLSVDQLEDAFLIMTPDLRFPQGSTAREQADNDGRIFEVPTNASGTTMTFGSQWNRPDRGAFRWSYYRSKQFNEWATPGTNRHDWPEMRVEEMRLLRAEGLYRKGDLAGGAAIINETRVPAGLNATDASGANTSCVPKLPNGSCGDLWEMLKWEARLELMYTGPHMSPWYFNGRGWGDLPQGVFLQMPVPGREAELLMMQPYTFGGTGESAAPVGTYGY
jgi:hypothetical protein